MYKLYGPHLKVINNYIKISRLIMMRGIVLVPRWVAVGSRLYVLVVEFIMFTI